MKKYMGCKPSNSRWVAEIEEGIRDFMWHKRTVQVEWKVFPENDKSTMLYWIKCWAVKNKVGVVKMRIFTWMCGKTMHDNIRESVWVALIIKKMMKNRQHI